MEPPDLRTSLMWLDGHGLSPESECWVLSDGTVQPVVSVTHTDDGNVTLHTRPPWDEPSPIPLHYDQLFDTLMESYGGGGHFTWDAPAPQTYRGSYVVNPDRAVFFVFLPDSVPPIVETHSEKMENQKQQAIELTREIERSETPHGT